MATSFVCKANLLLRIGSCNQSSVLCSALGIVGVRHKSKKGRTPLKHWSGGARGKSRGMKHSDGEYVERGMILFRQLGLKAYPGENVGCGRDLTLFAMRPGRVMITHEKLSPYPTSPLYPAVQAGRVVYKTFYHVIAEPQKQEFKLVSQT